MLLFIAKFGSIMKYFEISSYQLKQLYHMIFDRNQMKHETSYRKLDVISNTNIQVQLQVNIQPNRDQNFLSRNVGNTLE